MDIEINATDVVTVDSTSVEITTALDVSVDTSESTAVELLPDSYVITSLGLFTGNLDGSIPIWLLDAVDTALTTGDDNITEVVAGLTALVDELETGVNQNITQINSTNETVSALETSVVSRLDDNSSAILTLDTTKITLTESQAATAAIISSTFGGNVDAYIASIASTYVDENSAIAADVDVVVASVNGVTASVSEISVASVDEGEARAKHSLVVDVDGSIAGYVAETDGTTSEFIISADVFKVGSPGTNYTPLVVNTTDARVEFNGFVEFTGLGLDSDSTTIDGGKLDTGSVTATQIAADTITANEITSGTITATEIAANTITAVKLNVSTLSSISANIGTITAGSINADIITAGTIHIDRLPGTTSMQRYYASDTYAVPGENSWYTFASVTITVASGDIVDISTTFTASKGNNIAASSIRILRGSTLIYGTNTIGDWGNTLFALPVYTANIWVPNSLFISDTPGSGTFTYYAQFGTHGRLYSPYQSVRQRHMKASVFYT